MSKKDTFPLKEYMSQAQRQAMGDLPTTHENCLDKCKVARPGKTRRDRAKRAAALA